MMKVLIVEDEKPAFKQLSAMLLRYDSGIEIIGQIDTVKRAVAWFAHEAPPDLIFMDIQLADGLSFDIFEQVTIAAPIIFTTAYDQYAIQAFKVNSVDYLLKPIDPQELSAAIDKFKAVHRQQSTRNIPNQQLEQVQQAIRMLAQPYKNRFVVKVGEHIKAVSAEDVLYFHSHEKMTFMQVTGKKYIVDYTLDQIERLLDPKLFFRINRKYIIKIDAIQDIVTYSTSRLKLKILCADDPDIVVSRERVSDFKQWLDQ